MPRQGSGSYGVSLYNELEVIKMRQGLAGGSSTSDMGTLYAYISAIVGTSSTLIPIGTGTSSPLTTIADGATQIDFPAINGYDVIVELNGQGRLVYNDDYTISGTKIKKVAPSTFIAGEVYTVYLYNKI